MLESFNSDKFEYKRLSPEEQEKRGILGRLVGVIADTTNATRNGRKYGLDLWKKVFDDPIMKEKIANRCVFSELGHPEDRAEIDMEKVCACLAEQPKVGKDGKLYGVFDILNTTNGKILKTLCDYGTTVGISSRGTGDLYTDEDGNEAVDPDTYECECFDIVLIPAVETARLQYVTESYHGKTLKQALKEEYNNATDEEKKVMKETLEKLELDEGIESASIETDDQVIKIEIEDKDLSVEPIEMSSEEVSNLPVEGNDIDELEISDKEVEDEPEDAEDFGLEEVVENLQKALRKSYDLEKKVEELQTKLSVSNAKEIKLSEEVEKYKQSTQRLSEKAKSVKTLTEKVSQLEKTVQTQNTRITKLKEKLSNSSEESNNLNETIATKDSQIKRLQNQVKSLKESLANSSDITEQYSEKLIKAKGLVEKYKKAAQIASDRYIESQAKSYGLTKEQVSARLPESFTLKDVDNICESLSSHNIKVSRLPFDLTKNVRVTATPSTNESILGVRNTDDEVDESLLRLANL